MTASTEKQCKCRLCGDYFSGNEMSEEHYPARNTGNEDIVAVDLGKMFDTFISENVHAEIGCPQLRKHEQGYHLGDRQH